jgi:Tfp pilus assembly protein PilF
MQQPGSPALKPAPAVVPLIPEHELLRAIAAGAYGQVWLARNRLGVYRAVKIVHRASFDHDRPFEREFAGIKAFEPISRSHEGLVDLLQVGRDDGAGYFYYVMELADDLNGHSPPQTANAVEQSAFLDSYLPQTLASELKRRGRLPLDECVRIGLSLTKAVGYLHEQKLVHRDIKPPNIIFVGGVPKLADVGLVTGVGEAFSFVGTEGFIAPEGPGTPQADIYSLGILLYVLSTGKSHQDFPEPPADLTAQANHAQWLEFDAVVHKACQANVRERFQNAEAMHAELKLLEAGQSIRRHRATQRRWVAAKKLALGVIAVTLGFLAFPFLKGAKHAHTPNPEAVRLYKLGRWYYNQCTAKDHATAFTNLTQAVQIDPNFPEPYSVLTAIYGWATAPGVTTDKQRLDGMKVIVARLNAIDPNLAEAHAALSLCHLLERDWGRAEQEINRAIKTKPDYPLAHFLYCVYLCWEGRTDEAEREGKRALALEPTTDCARVSAIAAAWPFEAERRFDKAIAEFQKLLALDRNFAQGHTYLGDCYTAQSNYVAAMEEYRTSAMDSGEDPARVAQVFDALRQAYDTRGEQGYLRKWTEVMLADEALPDDQQLFGDVSGSDLAGYYARLGEKEKAFKELEKHFDEPNVWCQIKFNPLYDSLHNDPRFKALLKRANLEN